MNVKQPNRLYRADRLNYIVNRMRVHKDITPASLAEDMQVSERTIYRDLRSLEKGQSLKKRYSRKEGRYMLETELSLPALLLTGSEALALYVAASAPAMTHNGFFRDDLRAGLAKLGGLLARETTPDSESMRPAEALAETIQQPTLEVIRRAIRSNRKLQVKYWSSATDCETIITVAPYGLRFRDTYWYLLANAPDLGGVRPLRLSRIRAVEITEESFRFPRRFSAEQAFELAWSSHGESDRDIVVTIKFAPMVARVVAEHCAHQFNTMIPQSDGSLICTVAVASYKEIAWWVLSYGHAAEVLSPPDLRADFARTALSMAAVYVANPVSF